MMVIETTFEESCNMGLMDDVFYSYLKELRNVINCGIIRDKLEWEMGRCGDEVTFYLKNVNFHNFNSYCITKNILSDNGIREFMNKLI